jgi:trimethylamine--corrinoid protein Co-methyltransferase
LSALEKAGAKVDYAAERAWLPRRMVQEVIEAQKHRASPEERQLPNRIRAPGLPGLGCQVAQFYLDWAKKERRAGTRDDLVKMVKLGDVLHGGGSVGHCLLMRDVPAPIEPIVACALLIEYARSPGHTYPHYAEQFDYLMEIGEIYEGRIDRFLIGGIFITSPLRVCRRAADFMARRLKLGMECYMGTMACAGASVPVTLAGAIVVAAAEILGTWACIHAMRPEAQFRASIAAGSVDMRSGNTSYCSPEAMLLNLGTAEFFRRICGKRIGIAGASDYSDAKFPGLAAAYEKAFKVMTVSAFTGVQPPVGEGMLESGKTLSPEQLLIEREVTQHIQRLANPLDVSDEALALDAIREATSSVGQTFINTEHTLHHFRAALWHPGLLNRGVWQSFAVNAATEREIVDRAHEMVEEKVAQYVPPPVGEDKLKAIRKVVERARRKLCR